MITDLDNDVSRAQAVTAEALSDYSIDLGAAVQVGVGEQLLPYAKVGAAASNPTTSMTIAVVGADDAALTSNLVVLCSISVLAAALTANSLHKLPPVGIGTAKRYIGFRFTPVGGNASTGAFTAGFTMGAITAG